MKIKEILRENIEFDPSTVVWYHGTDQQFTYKPKAWMWATQSFEDAKDYATQYGEGIVYAIKLKPHKSVNGDAIGCDLNSISYVDNQDLLPKGSQSVYNELDIRIIDPNIITDIKAYRVSNRHKKLPKTAEPPRSFLESNHASDELPR